VEGIVHYTYEIVGGVLIVLSSLVSEQMPTKKLRIWAWIAFSVLAFAYSYVGILLSKQDRVEQDKRDASIQELQRKLDQSVLEQTRTTGELTAMKEIMGHLGQVGLPGFKEFGDAISGLTRNNERRAADATATNKQLCDKALDLTTKIRDFENKFETGLQSRVINAKPLPTNPEERQAEWTRRRQEEFQQSQEHSAQFLDQFLGSVKYLEDLMLAKLPLDKHDALVNNNGQAESSLILGTKTGAFDEYMIAGYLEETAKTLCPPKR
jgi:hypothetical protein